MRRETRGGTARWHDQVIGSLWTGTTCTYPTRSSKNSSCKGDLGTLKGSFIQRFGGTSMGQNCVSLMRGVL